jgi:tetratricopeptide (TPR) repeat protein
LNRLPEAVEKLQEAVAIFNAQAREDPSNASAQNDVAINHSKIGELLNLGGRTVEARREFERALVIHQRIAALDPENARLRFEVASDYNRLATVQAKLGERAASLENHTYAVTMSRALSASNPANVEQHVGVALALTGRGDAYAELARRRVPGSPPAADLELAERDYAEAVTLLEGLHAKGEIHGTDVKTLEDARKELARIRSERARLSR